MHPQAKDCPYYLSVPGGTCNGALMCSTYMEPLCLTNRPIEGWEGEEQ